MNPYSFTRFLENPRPRYPVQLIRSDANNILVQGDLPDCVQTPSSSSAIFNSDLSDYLTPFSLQNLIGNGDVSGGGVSHLSISLLPDVHPSHVSPQLPLHTLADELVSNESSSVLPDFLSGSHSAPSANPSSTVPSQQSVNKCDVPPVTTFMNRYVRSTSVPIIPMCDLNGQRHHSADYSSSRNQLPAVVLDPAPTRPVVVTTSDNPVSTPVQCISSRPCTIDPDAPPLSECLTRCRNPSSLEPCIHMLHNQLHQARTALAERELQLETLRAEMLVNQRQSELKIKALEHEVAKEKLLSAQDRWLVLQLKSQLLIAQGHADSTSNQTSTSSPVDHIRIVPTSNSRSNPSSSSVTIHP